MKNQNNKKKQTAIIPDKKSRGEWAEMRFLVAAAEHGLQVSKPWGEMSHYDFVTGHEGRLVRVQVKSTLYKVKDSKHAYSCAVRGGHRPYVGNVFDFVAAYVIPEDTWYIIPLSKIYGRGDVTLYPCVTQITDKMKYEKYKEAWHLLLSASANSLSKSKSLPGKIDSIEASAEEISNPSHISRVPHPSAVFARVGFLTSSLINKNQSLVILSKPIRAGARKACILIEKRAKTDFSHSFHKELSSSTVSSQLRTIFPLRQNSSCRKVLSEHA